MWIYLLVSLVLAEDFNIETAKEMEWVGAKIQVQVSPHNENKLRWSCEKSCKVSPEMKGDRLYVHWESEGLIQVKAPAIPLHIYANNAKVLIKNWKAPVKGRFLETSFTITESEGDLDIHTQKAHISINKQQGPMTMDIYEGDLYVDESSGDIKISHFAGIERLNKVQGEMHLQTQKVNTEIKDSKGKLTYNSIKGQMNLVAFQGEIRGESVEGISELNPSANSKLFWKADQGGVRLQVQRMNGAYMDLATKEGDLQLIPPLKAVNEGDWRVARAKLSGSEPGSVLVRTNKASIRVRSE